MKRIVVIAAAFFMLTGVVFAQDLRLDGYFNTGLGIISNDVDGDDSRVKAFGVDSEQNGYRFRLNGSYQNEARTAGFRFRLQSQVSHSAGYLSMPFAFGWVNFLDNKLSINAGIIEDGTWSTGDYWLASDSVSDFTGLGTLIKVTPIDGLVLGLGAQTVGRDGGGANNRLSDATFGRLLSLEDARITGHFVYTMPDMFRIGFSYRTEGRVNATPSGYPGDADNPVAWAPVSSKLYGDFRFLGVSNLTAVVSASFDNLGEDFENTGVMTFSETFAYRVEDIRFGLNAVQFMYNREDRDTSMLFNVWGSYTINDFVPRLDVVYFMGGSSTAGASAATWHRKGFSASGNPDISLLSIRPSLRINLDSRTHLEIGDMINIDSNAATDTSVLTNVFYIDLRWSF